MNIKTLMFRSLSPGERTAAKKVWADVDKEFIPSGRYWLAIFEVDGKTRAAGIWSGRRVDVADDIEQFRINLRVNNEEFDADDLIPEAQVADITRAIGEAFEKGEYWRNLPPVPDANKCKTCGKQFVAGDKPHWCGQCLDWFHEECMKKHPNHAPLG
jgi:hypothetical protein